MRERIHEGLVENSAPFHPKIIVYEGMAGWGAIYSRLVEGLQRLGWRRDGDNWRPPAGVEFEKAYAALCHDVPPAPGMAHENMQPLIEGGYPDSEVWFEQFGSYPELRIEGGALVFHAAPMTAARHIGFLYQRAQECRESDAHLIAMDLVARAKEIEDENQVLPSPEQARAVLARRHSDDR
jgi:hypothetical protein